MPGYEIIDKKEFEQVSEILKKAKRYLEWDLIFREKEYLKYKNLKNLQKN